MSWSRKLCVDVVHAITESRNMLSYKLFRDDLHFNGERGMSVDEATKLEMNIRQMRDALIRIRDEAATKDNGGSWAAGLAALCLATLRN